MKIVFMGTPDFARDSLKAVVEAGHEVALVVTNPDKPKGRPIIKRSLRISLIYPIRTIPG